MLFDDGVEVVAESVPADVRCGDGQAAVGDYLGEFLRIDGPEAGHLDGCVTDLGDLAKGLGDLRDSPREISAGIQLRAEPHVSHPGFPFPVR